MFRRDSTRPEMFLGTSGRDSFPPTNYTFPHHGRQPDVSSRYQMVDGRSKKSGILPFLAITATMLFFNSEGIHIIDKTPFFYNAMEAPLKTIGKVHNKFFGGKVCVDASLPGPSAAALAPTAPGATPVKGPAFFRYCTSSSAVGRDKNNAVTVNLKVKTAANDQEILGLFKQYQAAARPFYYPQTPISVVGNSTTEQCGADMKNIRMAISEQAGKLAHGSVAAAELRGTAPIKFLSQEPALDAQNNPTKGSFPVDCSYAGQKPK